MGTVIVLAVTIALGVLLYAYSQGMFGSLTQNVNVNVQAQIIVNPSSNQAYLQYSLTNNGNLKVYITQISVQGTGISSGTMNVNITLLPGDSYSNVTPLSGTLSAGSYYTVIITGHTSTGKPVQLAENVLASTTE